MPFIFRLVTISGLFLWILLLNGCSSTLPYADDDVVAVVRGEEITIRDLRFLYPDDEVLDKIEYSIQERLVIQEAKRMNLDVTEQLEESLPIYPDDEDHSEWANAVREFAELQANKLGMEPREYYEQYHRKLNESSLYQNQYFHEVLGEPHEEDSEVYEELAYQLMNDLMSMYADEIEIYIKP